MIYERGRWESPQPGAPETQTPETDHRIIAREVFAVMEDTLGVVESRTETVHGGLERHKLTLEDILKVLDTMGETLSVAKQDATSQHMVRPDTIDRMQTKLFTVRSLLEDERQTSARVVGVTGEAIAALTESADTIDRVISGRLSQRQGDLDVTEQTDVNAAADARRRFVNAAHDFSEAVSQANGQELRRGRSDLEMSLSDCEAMVARLSSQYEGHPEQLVLLEAALHDMKIAHQRMSEGSRTARSMFETGIDSVAATYGARQQLGSA